jgi:hypothetical protein
MGVPPRCLRNHAPEPQLWAVPLGTRELVHQDIRLLLLRSRDQVPGIARLYSTCSGSSPQHHPRINSSVYMHVVRILPVY